MADGMIIPHSRPKPVFGIRLCVWDVVCAGVAGWTGCVWQAAEDGWGVGEESVPGATGLFHGRSGDRRFHQVGVYV